MKTDFLQPDKMGPNDKLIIFAFVDVLFNKTLVQGYHNTISKPARSALSTCFHVIRYSSCRQNERQLIDVTVVRRVRPRAERWCDCEGHRRWKRAGSTLFGN